jgi:hypothetical protein
MKHSLVFLLWLTINIVLFDWSGLIFIQLLHLCLILSLGFWSTKTYIPGLGLLDMLQIQCLIIYCNSWWNSYMIYIMKCESHSCFICVHYYCVTDLKSYTYMTSFYYENGQQCTYDIWSWSYDGWISNYLYKQCLSPLTSWIRIPLKWNHP